VSIRSNRITAPRPPDSPAPFRFPLIASTAPVVVAVVIWVITGSIFALIFAALGPVTAIGSFIDSRVRGRRAGRRERARFEREIASVTLLVKTAHAHEVAALEEVLADATSIIAKCGADPYRWNLDSDGPVPIGLGIGQRVSEVEVDGLSAAGHLNPDVNDALVRLANLVSQIDAPLATDARLGVALCGPTALTSAWARALVVQLAWTLAPDRFWYRRQDSTELIWMDGLPHEREPGEPGRGALLEFGLMGQAGALVLVATAEDPQRLRGGCKVVVCIDDDADVRIVEHPDRASRQSIAIAALSREDAVLWADRICTEAVRDGRVVASTGLPDRVTLSEVLEAGFHGPGLSAPVGRAAAGDVVLDLVAQGPHAVIGGTTGSGKSELLIGWVLSMAASHSPAVVNFLLVDFKGGAAFAALESLPHTVGTITDLDDETARRALESLRAELKFRERTLALATARSIDDHDGLTRLVIVVDEFQAMLADYPELHTLFADIAARGRSLGVHLILCTQRPGGAVRDGVLANADLRISLRVNNGSDSVAVVGCEDAVRIPTMARGRAVVRAGGIAAGLVQFAIADAAVIDTVTHAWPGVPKPRRPWCEPLPAHILARDLPPITGGIAFGILDLPLEQRRDIAVWNPRSGHLLVVGGPRSGKTAALATIAAAEPDALVLPPEPEQAWEILTALAARPEAVTLVIDDLDSLLARFPSDYRMEFVERLMMLLREGPSWGMGCAISAVRLGSDLSAHAGLFVHRLTLAQSSRHEHILAGGEGAHFREGLPPGAGIWQGARIQVALPAHPLITARVDPIIDLGPGPIAIVTGRVALVTRSFAADRANDILPLDRELTSAIDGASGRAVVIADPDQWQAQWGALIAVRSRATVVLHACSSSDFRALTRSRELPPLLANGDAEACWVLDENGFARRSRLPLILQHDSATPGVRAAAS
jgi:S-DNA-T family DNA segregation ATPase FtsK/SpoIIIE